MKRTEISNFVTFFYTAQMDRGNQEIDQIIFIEKNYLHIPKKERKIGCLKPLSEVLNLFKQSTNLATIYHKWAWNVLKASPSKDREQEEMKNY